MCWPPMANHAVVTPDSLTKQVFIYVLMGSLAFLIGIAVMIGLVPVNG